MIRTFFAFSWLCPGWVRGIFTNSTHLKHISATERHRKVSKKTHHLYHSVFLALNISLAILCSLFYTHLLQNSTLKVAHFFPLKYKVSNSNVTIFLPKSTNFIQLQVDPIKGNYDTHAAKQCISIICNLLNKLHNRNTHRGFHYMNTKYSPKQVLTYLKA